MPYTEDHRGIIRVRYKGPEGKYVPASRDDQGQRFDSHDDAMEYGRYQESLIKRGLWIDPNAGAITFGEWAELWYAGLDLEPSTMRNYRNMLQGHVLPRWRDVPLDQIAPEMIAPWERSIVRAGYALRTAQDARRLLVNVLGDAVPTHIPYNPAARRRGKGRKGLRRIERIQQAAKAWSTPVEVVLIAERAAMLAGNPDVFTKLVTKGWTGLRWSELLALTPDALLKDGRLHVEWKLYELGGMYWGHPKDGSLRTIHLPPFLRALLADLAQRAQWCSCTGRDEELPRVDGEEAVEWCTGRRRLLFLTGEGAHYGRGGFSGSVMRPAADGVHPGKAEKRWPRPPRPVIAQVGGGTWTDQERETPFPGRPLRPAWPYAARPPGEWSYPDPAEWEMPRRRGQWRWLPGDGEDGERCRQIVTWLPIRPGLTPHGLRHGHQTWMDDGNIKKALKVERMGHEDRSMSGLYGHVTEGMVAELLDLLEGLWEQAIADRFEIHPRSPVPALDAAMAPWREGNVTKIVSPLSPQTIRKAASR
jgi:integrase